MMQVLKQCAADAYILRDFTRGLRASRKRNITRKNVEKNIYTEPNSTVYNTTIRIPKTVMAYVEYWCDVLTIVILLKVNDSKR